jgi:hypothetical protein
VGGRRKRERERERGGWGERGDANGRDKVSFVNAAEESRRVPEG